MDPPRAIRGTFPKSVLMMGWARDQVDCPHHPCFSPTDENQITFTRKRLRSTLELAECHLLNGLREDDISTRNCRFWGSIPWRSIQFKSVRKPRSQPSSSLTTTMTSAPH